MKATSDIPAAAASAAASASAAGRSNSVRFSDGAVADDDGIVDRDPTTGFSVEQSCGEGPVSLAQLPAAAPFEAEKSQSSSSSDTTREGRGNSN